MAASGPHAVAIIDREAPSPGAGEVRVSVRACGICGSDLHALHQGFAKGHIPGHEIAGVIDALGADVDDLTIGTSVAVEPLSSCGTCDFCNSGQPALCRSAQIFGVQLPGGMTDAIVVPANRVHAIDASLRPEVAALTEPVAVGIHACRRVALEADERVLVLGAGSIGLLALVAAKACGARDVWITARHAHQAELARSLGADRVLDARTADRDELSRLGCQTDIDVAIETVGGAADTLDLAAAALRPGGRVAVLGLFDAPLEINPWPLLIKEASVHFSNCYAHPSGEAADFEVAARLVEDERERLAALCTHTLPLAEASRGFALADDKSSGAIKVSLLPQPGKGLE